MYQNVVLYQVQADISLLRLGQSVHMLRTDSNDPNCADCELQLWRRVPCRSPQRRSQAQAPCLGCSTGESLALSLLSPSNSGPSAKGQPYKIPDLKYGTAAASQKSDFMPRKSATSLEQSHALPSLPSQARARSRAAASARSRVRGGSCCARNGTGQASPS